MKDQIKTLADLISRSKKTTFFGGAGVSTESGIPDFRGAKGLYLKKQSIPPEVILSHSFFIREPAVFYAYYTENLLSPKAKPNSAHKALAVLEEKGLLSCVVTQNIDGLHQLAGSRIVLELHGTANQYHCMDCGRIYGTDYILSHLPLPECACGGLVRPDVVLYEEGLDEAVTGKAVRQIQQSELMIIGGTSLNVYPAAAYARLCPGRMVIINKTATPFDEQADLVIREKIGETLALTLEELGFNPG